MRILVVEDQSVAEVFRQQFADAFPDAEVSVTGSLRGALQAVANDKPDLILLDLTLDDAKREETMLHLADFARDAECVIVTGHNLEEVAKMPGMIEGIPMAAKSDLFTGRGAMFRVLHSLLAKKRPDLGRERSEETARIIGRMEQLIADASPQ